MTAKSSAATSWLVAKDEFPERIVPNNPLLRAFCLPYKASEGSCSRSPIEAQISQSSRYGGYHPFVLSPKYGRVVLLLR